jgi:tetratricopeptide (TPR) repeat protein
MNFNKAMEVAPADPAAYIQLAKLRLVQKRPADAAKLFQQVLTQDPSSMDALEGIVFMDTQQNQAPQAIAAVRAQIAKSPNNSAFYVLLGQLLLNSKDPAGAETAAQKAIDINSDNLDAILLLAHLEQMRGAVDQAASAYQQAMQKHPNDVRFYFELANLEDSRGNWQQAEKLYQQALLIKPEDPELSNNLAYLMVEHGGDKDAAMSLAQTARRGLPNAPITADTLGWAYYYQGWYPSAVSILQTAVKESPNVPTYHYHLGMALQKTGDSAHAKQELERALELHPSPEQASDIRKALGQTSGG